MGHKKTPLNYCYLLASGQDPHPLVYEIDNWSAFTYRLKISDHHMKMLPLLDQQQILAKEINILILAWSD